MTAPPIHVSQRRLMDRSATVGLVMRNCVNVAVALIAPADPHSSAQPAGRWLLVGLLEQRVTDALRDYGREQLALLHDTAASTLLMVGQGTPLPPQRLSAQARRDLTRLDDGPWVAPPARIEVVAALRDCAAHRSPRRLCPLGAERHRVVRAPLGPRLHGGGTHREHCVRRGVSRGSGETGVGLRRCRSARARHVG